jgi:U3 small nucleolar RNA-associated protein 6
MAEHVQAALDAMILPLLDLQERQIFSPDEIRAIVQRRRESEYLLRRRNARKSDYVSYLQNEMQLERLRALRSKQQKKKQRLLASSSAHERIQQQQTKHVGDKHVLQHILLLWTRTMRKFRGDLGLWLQYLEFLKQHGRHQRLSAAYAQALQLHPRATGLWVEASSWELFEQSSVDSARVLLQRGLRLNPSSRELWLHFFRLEMHVVQKLAGRKLLLQLGDGTTSQKDEPSESPFANHSDNNSIDDGSAKKNDPYSLARVVLDHAAHALAKKNENELLGLYSDCLQSCRSFPYTQGLQRHLLHQLRRRGPNTVASWMAQIAWIRNNPGIPFVDDSDDEPDAKRVRLMTSKIGQPVERPLVHLRDPVLKLLRLATQELPTEAMYREAIRFLGRYLQQKDEEPDNKEDDDGKNDEQSTAESDEGGMLLDALWREARASDFFSSALVLEYADYHLDKRQYEDRAAVEVAVNVLQDFVEGYSNSSSGGGGGGGGGTHMVSAAVWTRLAQLQSVSRATPSDESVATLRRGLEQTPPYQTDHLVLLLHLFGALLARSAGKAPSELWILLDRILLLYPGFITKMEDVPDPPFGIRNVPEACLEFQQHVANEQGLDWTRRLYEKLLFRSGLVELLRQCPEMVHYIEGIVDQAVTAEARCAIPKERRKNLLRILEFAVRHAPSTSSKERYLAAKENLQFRFVCGSQNDFTTCFMPSWCMHIMIISPYRCNCLHFRLQRFVYN